MSGDPVVRTKGRVTLIDGILATAALVDLVLNAALGWWWRRAPSRAGLWPGRWPSRPGPRQGVTATPSEPWDGAVTVAGDKRVILPVTGLIANCDRTPSPSLVT